MPIKTFRGQMEDNTIDTISLHTNDGSVGYRIKKLQILPIEPGKLSQEITVQVFSIPQTAVGTVVDFSNQTLLAVAVFAQHENSWNSYDTVIFDNMTFNQDIFVTLQDTQNADGGNYYLELETVPLALDENTVATLKDIRNIEGRNDSA